MTTPARDPFDLTGRVAFITGGGGGIGSATAYHLGRRGAAITVVDVRKEQLDEVVDGLRAEGVPALGIELDVTDPGGVDAAVAQASGEFGPVDLLVNNAAIGNHVPPETLELADWHRILEVDLTGYFLTARAVARGLIDEGRPGAVVNISSIAGSSALGRGNFAYSVAKGGVNQLTRELAIEWASLGIRVNAIQPCQVATPLFNAWVASPDEQERGLLTTMLAGIPLRRLAQAEDIAAAVHFLGSDAAAMITGVILPVDGGNLALNPGGTLR